MVFEVVVKYWFESLFFEGYQHRLRKNTIERGEIVQRQKGTENIFDGYATCKRKGKILQTSASISQREAAAIIVLENGYFVIQLEKKVYKIRQDGVGWIVRE